MKSASLLDRTGKISHVGQKIHSVKGPLKIGKRFKYITDKIKMSQYEQDFIHLLENEYIQQLRYFLNKKSKILFICQKMNSFHSQERHFLHRNKVNGCKNCEPLHISHPSDRSQTASLWAIMKS